MSLNWFVYWVPKFDKEGKEREVREVQPLKALSIALEPETVVSAGKSTEVREVQL